MQGVGYKLLIVKCAAWDVDHPRNEKTSLINNNNNNTHGSMG